MDSLRNPLCFNWNHLGSVPQQSIANTLATATNAGARIGWRAKGGRWQLFATKATRIRGWRPFRNLLDTPEVEQLDPEKLWLEDDPFLLGPGNFSAARC